MRYMSLETLSHLAISDLSREAVKKHQDVVLKALKVSWINKNTLLLCTIMCGISVTEVQKFAWISCTYIHTYIQSKYKSHPSPSWCP